MGLIEKVLGHKRPHPCVAGEGLIFIDSWNEVWACNVRTDLPMGNLDESSWENIINSKLAKEKLLKYHGVSKSYFHLYLKEMEFRYNYRKEYLYH